MPTSAQLAQEARVHMSTDGARAVTYALLAIHAELVAIRELDGVEIPVGDGIGSEESAWPFADMETHDAAVAASEAQDKRHHVKLEPVGEETVIPGDDAA